MGRNFVSAVYLYIGVCRMRCMNNLIGLTFHFDALVPAANYMQVTIMAGR